MATIPGRVRISTSFAMQCKEVVTKFQVGHWGCVPPFSPRALHPKPLVSWKKSRTHQQDLQVSCLIHPLWEPQAKDHQIPISDGSISTHGLNPTQDLSDHTSPSPLITTSPLRAQLEKKSQPPQGPVGHPQPSTKEVHRLHLAGCELGFPASEPSKEDPADKMLK